MSGVTPLIDTLLATRLAQRVDLVPLKGQIDIAGPDAVAHVQKVTNDVRLPSRAALQQQLRVPRLGHGDIRNTLPLISPGKTVTLSAAARAISAILDLPAAVTPKIRGREPLWSHLQPPVAQLLMATLARTVATSGLFYESHLQQYASGRLTRAQLDQEPQARLGALTNLPLERPAAGGAGLGEIVQMTKASDIPLDATGALLDVAGASDIGAESLLSARLGIVASSEPVSRQLPVGLDSANLAATYSRVSLLEKEYPSNHDIGGQAENAESPGESNLNTGGNRNPVAAGIHPGAIELVHQQLDLLAMPIFRWAGEAWPGTSMDWEIHEELGEDQDTADSKEAQRTWSTHLAMTLPTLGVVDVRLSLSGTRLQVSLAAREKDTVDLLSDAGTELPQRFDALGLQLNGLQIDTMGLEPAAQDVRKADDAA